MSLERVLAQYRARADRAAGEPERRCHHQPRPAAARRRGRRPGRPALRRLDSRHEPARARPGAVRRRSRVPPRRPAVDSQRVHSRHGSRGQRGRDATPARVRSRRRRVPRQARRAALPQLDRGLRDTRRRDQAARRKHPRGRLECAHHDVRLQQALLRTSGPLLLSELQAARRRETIRASGFSLSPFSRAHLRGHAAVGRHVRLRSRDGARRCEWIFAQSVFQGSSPRSRCRREARPTTLPRCCTPLRRESRTPASSGPTRASRS